MKEFGTKLCTLWQANSLSEMALNAWCELQCKLRSDSGQGVAEYIIILAIIVIACIALAIAFNNQLTALWERVTGALGGI